MLKAHGQDGTDRGYFSARDDIEESGCLLASSNSLGATASAQGPNT